MTPPRLCISLFSILVTVSPAFPQAGPHAMEWLTTPDRSSVLALQNSPMAFSSAKADADNAGAAEITVDERQTLQPIDGFGFALTGGSAELMMKMSPPARHRLLEEVFGTHGAAIGASYLRVSIGSSDMNERVFTYDDLQRGKTDPLLKHFQLGPDLADVVPVLQEILRIAPHMKILATPWSAPSWMKTNELPKGGSLRPDAYQVYARYLATYVRAMQQHGIRIDAITPQNEPLNPKNTPSMVMTAEDESAFIAQALGPVFQRRHIDTKIIIYDHNCDRPDYAMTILANRDAAQYVDGSGFHLYEGEITAMTKVHDAFPQKHIYFTEQMVVDDPAKGPELRIAEPVASIVIGATSNWSRNVLLWNLAADPSFGPHTNDGGCPVCEGAITLDRDAVTRNAAYYTIAHASKFVPPGSMHIASKAAGDAPAQVAFRTPDGRIVLLTANTTGSAESFTIRFHGNAMPVSMPPGAVATFVWPADLSHR